MNVQSLWIYPVKSLAGIEVDSFELDDFGPSHDRRWMLVDDTGRFVTQRLHPELAQVGTFLDGSRVSVEIPGHGAFTLSATEAPVDVEVWGDEVTAVLDHSGASDAISGFCGRALRFVFMPESSFRQVDPDYVSERRRVGFADGYPLLIANSASLEELNGRLDKPVEMRRFRPNVVVAGESAWQEDGWRNADIGGIRFSLVKPCSRCIMTTVDPERGVKDAGGQPLKTLKDYRRQEQGVMFGMNAVHHGPGRIRVGERVSIVD